MEGLQAGVIDAGIAEPDRDRKHRDDHIVPAGLERRYPGQERFDQRDEPAADRLRQWAEHPLKQPGGLGLAALEGHQSRQQRRRRRRA